MRTAAGVLLAGVLTLMGGGGVLAQASPAPDAGTSAGLRSALGSVPAGPEAFAPTVSFADLAAVVDARAGAAHPADLPALLAALDADDPAAQRWMAAMMGVSSGASEIFRGLLGSGQEWPTVVGFDPLQLDRVLAFGSPPANGTVLEGRFDPAAIGAALAARGFVAGEFGSFNGWCSPDGCEEGLRADLQHRDPADPFGGQLGRRQPLAVSADTLLSSASDATVSAMVAASEGSAPSLATHPAVSAVLDALDAASDARLLQAELVPGELLAFDPGVLLGSSSPEDVQAILERLSEGFEPIAPASLLLIADGASDTEQVAHLVLAYGTRADAEQAATVIPKRLAAMSSLVADRSWQELLDDRGVTSVEGTAVPLGDGAAATVITLRAPLAGDEPDPDSGRLTTSSHVYSLLVRALMTRDLVWLAPALPEVP